MVIDLVDEVPSARVTMVIGDLAEVVADWQVEEVVLSVSRFGFRV